MSPTIVLDTNVFYNLGAGSITLASIVSSNETIAYSPLSVLEIAGKFTTRTFAERRNAARAILESKATELPDPESFLTKDVFGYKLLEGPVSFHEGVIAMSLSTNVKDLVSGVTDFRSRVVRRVSIPKAHGWRLVTEGDWVKAMLKIQRDTIPKFRKWENSNRRKPVPRLTGNERVRFLANTITPGWALTLVLACQQRALLAAQKDTSLLPTRTTVVTLAKAIESVSCYCTVYTHYLVRLLTESALPEPNDSGDIELFLYSVDDDHIVATSEKKWKRLAESAGFGQRIRLI